MTIRTRFVAAMVAVALSASQANASVYSEMNDWFNDIGAYGNITGPQAISGQTGTTFTGGSLYMRTPVRNYQLFAFQPPTIRSGCGGIDLHAGSFSFINTEAFTALLRNIGNAAIGAAFMMAVESVSPELAGILKSLQQFAQAANNMNINSCQAGQALASAALDLGKSMFAKEDTAARSEAANRTNMFTDALDAATKFMNDINARKNAMIAMKNSDSGLKEALESKNVAWYALRKLNISEDMTMLMMSLTGTVIVRATDKAASSKPEVESKPGTITFEQLVGGPDSPQVKVKIYRCLDGDLSQYGCLSVDTYDDYLYSFYYRVKKLLADGRVKVVSRAPMSFGDSIDKSLYANSTIPLWKLVSANAAGAVAMHDDMYAKVVSTQLAYAYLMNITQEIRKALSANKASLDESNVKATRELEENLDKTVELAISKYNAALQEASAVAKQQDNIQWFVNTIYNVMPGNMRQNLAFGAQGSSS